MPFVAYATPELDAKSQYPTIIAICAVMSVLAIGIVSLRLKIRSAKNGLMLDDWMALAAMVMGVAYSCLCIAQTKYGLGLPPAIRPKQALSTYAKVNFAGRPIYQLGISFFKMALLVSYLRLLQGSNFRTYRRVVWGAIAFVFLNHLACTLSLIFACSPIDKSWKPLKQGKCIPDGPSFTAYAALTIASDILVAVLPVPVLLKLEIALGKKLGLIGIFALGLFTTVCSILRYTQINRIQFGDHDSTMLVVWGVIEFNVGNMLTSLPFLAPVFVRKAKSRYYRSKRSKDGYASNYSPHASKKFAEAHELGGMQSDARTVTGANHTSSSEEDILQGNNAIMKSITYSVRVDDEELDYSRRMRQKDYM